MSEMQAWGEFYRAASADTISACGLDVGELGGALATLFSAADALGLNRVIGLGLERPAGSGDVDDLVDLYENAGVPRFFVQVNPASKPSDLGSLLEARGLRHYNNWVKLYRDVSPPPGVSTDLTVRRIDERDAEAFGRIVAGSFDWPEPASGWVAELVGRPNWRHYMVFDGETPVATGAMHVQDGQGWIDFASTLSDYRGRGAQGALLAQRIRDAAELGLRRLVVETAEDTPQKGAPSFRNMLKFGFRVAYVRPNYLGTTG
jgi:GNAT superfamily N-acetyltransferase